MERCANHVNEWFYKCRGLQLAPQKSSLVIFSRSAVVRGTQWSVKIKESGIVPRSTAKFLGLHFQDNLKWNRQIDSIVESCLRPIAIMGFLRSTWWGAASSLVLLLYKAIVRSRIEYCAFVWFQLPNYLRVRLEEIQNRSLKIALGY